MSNSTEVTIEQTPPGRLLSREAMGLLWLQLWMLVAFTLFRAAFLFMYPDEFDSVPMGELARAFAQGVRFDLSATSMVFVGLVALAHVPYLSRMRAYRYLWVVAAQFAAVFYFVLLASDLQYYHFGQKRLGYEAFAYLGSIGPVLVTALRDTPVVFISSLLAVVGLMYALWRWARGARLLEPSGIGRGATVVAYLVIVPLLIVGIRGGVQRVPLRLGDSFISNSHAALNTLTINSPFLVLKYSGEDSMPRLMPRDEALSRARSLLGLQGAPADPRYPLLVECQGAAEPKRYNVVLILVESLSAKFIGALGSKVAGLTPEFDALARQGLLFNRFYANGSRTPHGVFITLTGFMDQAQRPLMLRQGLRDNFSSLSRLLKDEGYSTMFVHGGPLDFDNLEGLMRKERFDVVMGMNDMQGCDTRKTTWGCADGYIYDTALEQMRQHAGKPFFLYMLTVSMHTPYELPSNGFNKLGPSDHPQYEFLNALYYADYALGEFIRKASVEPYFKDTIFLITADHTHHVNLNAHDSQHIPLLIYAPGIVEPGVRSTVGSQTDIVPTVAGLLGLRRYASTGRDLMAIGQDEGYAFYFLNTNLGWIEKDTLSIVRIDDALPMVYGVGAGASRRPIYSPDAERIKKDAYALYQCATDLLRDDAIYPAKDAD